MSRNLAITAADSQTGRRIAELILTDAAFSGKIRSLTAFVSSSNERIKGLGAAVVVVAEDDKDALVKGFRDAEVDTLCLVPSAAAVAAAAGAVDTLLAARDAGVQNVLLISAAACDMAHEVRQPRLREYVQLEAQVLGCRSDTGASTAAVLRAGFCAENLLLLLNRQAPGSGKLPLPVGDMHRFAPVALADVGLLAAHVLTGEGPHGFNDQHRGQLMVLTGPTLASGDELAAAASDALGIKMQYEDTSEDRDREDVPLHSTDTAAAAEMREYFSLVRAGKTNYVATHSFQLLTGRQVLEMPDFFRAHAAEMKPKRRRTGK